MMSGCGPLHATGTNPRFADDIIRWSWTNEMFVRGCKRAAAHDKKTGDDAFAAAEGKGVVSMDLDSPLFVSQQQAANKKKQLHPEG